MDNFKTQLKKQVLTIVDKKTNKLAVLTGISYDDSLNIITDILCKAYDGANGDFIKFEAKRTEQDIFDYLETSGKIYELYMIAKILFTDDEIFICDVHEDDVNF